MKVQVERLRTVLKLLKPVVPRKTSLPITTHVKLGEGRVVATDLEVYVTVSDVGESEAGEAVCLPYGLLVDLLASLPGYEVADITVDGKTATIVVSGTVATLNALPGKDFPPGPDFSPEHDVAVDGDTLVRARSVVLPYVAKEESRPVLTAVCLTLGDATQAVAADGFRLAWQPAPKLPGEGNLLIPGRAVAVLEHLWKHAPKPPDLEKVADIAHLAVARRLVRLEYSRAPLKPGDPPCRLRLTFGEVSGVVHLVSGTFPSYQRLIPKYSPSVTFSASDLLRALRSVAPMARDGSGIVRLSWGDGKLQVKASAEDTGSTSTSIPAQCQRDGAIAFNINYLLGYLKYKDGVVTLSTEAPSAPGLLSYRGVADLVVMPMFVQPEGKAQSAKPKQGPEPTPATKPATATAPAQAPAAPGAPKWTHEEPQEPKRAQAGKPKSRGKKK